MIKYDFETLADRSVDNARKWDKSIVNNKFPNVREDFIPMWIADMDFKAAPEIRNTLIKMSENGAYGYTYTTDRWYDSVVSWFGRRHQVDIESEWLTLGYGTVPNMHIFIQEFLEENDAVLLNTPIYGPFAYSAQHNNRQIIDVPLLKNENHYDLDFTTIEAALRRTDVKAIFFCNPHNPSGRIWKEAEIEKIAELCLQNNVILVSDEVHSEHIISGKFFSALQLESKYLQNLVVFSSPNKAFNLGGLKLSFSIIPNLQLREKFRSRYLKNSVTSPNVPGQIAMITAYEECGEWLNQCEQYIKENLEITKSYLKLMPGWNLMEMESSYLPWIDVSKTGMTTFEIANMMATKAGVIVGTGDDYVSHANEFLRLNLGTSSKLVKESMKRMSDVWLKKVGIDEENEYRERT